SEFRFPVVDDRLSQRPFALTAPGKSDFPTARSMPVAHLIAAFAERRLDRVCAGVDVRRQMPLIHRAGKVSRIKLISAIAVAAVILLAVYGVVVSRAEDRTSGFVERGEQAGIKFEMH